MKRALAIFAKAPLPGKVKTRLTPPLSAAAGAELYRCMLLDTVARVRSLGIDTFVFYEGRRELFLDLAPEARLLPQHPGNLGERLEQAFDALRELGYRARVVIGTDAPDLPLQYVQEAFQRIEHGEEAVFGPAVDGGYYLVGLRGRYAEIFREIPWSTDKVLEMSLVRARSAGIDSFLLPEWYDVDSFDDLCRPGLSDPCNGAPLTRRYIAGLSCCLRDGKTESADRLVR